MHTKPIPPTSGAPESFLTKFGQQITGILCSFDRLRFRATQRLLFQPRSMEAYLTVAGLLIKHFKAFAKGITQRVKAAAYQAAVATDRTPSPDNLTTPFPWHVSRLTYPTCPTSPPASSAPLKPQAMCW